MEEKYELNLSVNRFNPDGLRILSLRGCTAACIVNLVFGEVEGWEGGKGSVLDHGSAVEACCMLCVWVCGIFLGECYVVLHETLHYVAWLPATLSLPAACQTPWMLADALRLPRTWLLGMPDTHKHSGTPARAQFHHHCTAVLAIFSAQRSCSEVYLMDADWMG